MQRAIQDLVDLHPPGLNPDGKYSMPWILRCRLLALIGAKSLNSLKISNSDSLELMKKAFPDAKDWLDLYSKGASNVRELVLDLALNDRLIPDAYFEKFHEKVGTTLQNFSNSLLMLSVICENTSSPG